MARLYHRTFEEYLIAPIGPASFVIGKILAGALRGLLSCAVILVLAYFFGASLHMSLGFFLVLGLTCLLFGAMGLIAAMLINSHEDMANFGTYFLLPMSFLCATFFSADTLPHAIRLVIEILPLTHAVYALRMLAAGGVLPWLSLAVLMFYTVTFIGAGIWTMLHVRD